jgi:hypothetical protein
MKNSSCKFFEPEHEIQTLAMQKIVTTTSTCGWSIVDKVDKRKSPGKIEAVSNPFRVFKP